MAKAIPFGLDTGNGSLKAWSSGMTEGYLIPSVYSKVVEVNHHAGTAQVDYTPDEIIDNLDITYVATPALAETNQRYFIGKQVAKGFKNDGNETAENSLKYLDKTPALIGLAALAVDAIKRNPNKRKIKINYDLAVALPIKDILHAELHAKRFQGIHNLIVHQPSGNDIDIVIEVEASFCLPEGAAAAWGVVYDEKGRIIKYSINRDGNVVELDFKNKPLVHADLGAGTTELVYTKGIQYYHELSQPNEFGTKKIINEIRAVWNANPENMRKQIPSTDAFNRAYYDSTNFRHNALKPLADKMMVQRTEKLGTDLINFYDRFTAQTEEVLPFIIYGGGAILLKDILLKIFTANKLLDVVIFLNDPLFTNAKGLLVYASSPVFAQKKAEMLASA